MYGNNQQSVETVEEPLLLPTMKFESYARPVRNESNRTKQALACSSRACVPSAEDKEEAERLLGLAI
jgi:hypothetical protein